MGNECPPAQRIESLLEEREQYINRQKQIRQERMETELHLLLVMIDERSAEDPHLIREIQNEHVDSGGLSSFDTLYDEWKSFGHKLDRLYSHQQRVEIDLATCVLDTDETVLADLDEAIETVCSMRAAPDGEDDTTPDEL